MIVTSVNQRKSLMLFSSWLLSNRVLVFLSVNCAYHRTIFLNSKNPRAVTEEKGKSSILIEKWHP